MHDTLQYFGRDAIHRAHHQDELTFRALYGFTENYVLPLSHDEVVHGKGSLLGRMPGDAWQRLANLRLLYGYQWTVPGKKLLFMGGELAQEAEWSHEKSLDWHLLQDPGHAGVERWVADLNRAYAGLPALHERDADAAGFEWVDTRDSANSVLSFLRRGRTGGDVLVVCNFTPVVRSNYRVGVPQRGYWREVLNSDATAYGGSGSGNLGGVHATPVPSHGRTRSVNLTLPPLGIVVLVHDDEVADGGEGETA
jgi:1,4-alpha-glucan branching enzyme